MNYGSPQGPVANLREHGNLHLGFTKAEYFCFEKLDDSCTQVKTMLHEVRCEYTYDCDAISRNTNNPKNDN